MLISGGSTVVSRALRAAGFPPPLGWTIVFAGSYAWPARAVGLQSSGFLPWAMRSTHLSEADRRRVGGAVVRAIAVQVPDLGTFRLPDPWERPPR